MNGYHLVMLLGVNTLRYMHIVKEIRNFQMGIFGGRFQMGIAQTFYLGLGKWAFTVCIFGDHPVLST